MRDDRYHHDTRHAFHMTTFDYQNRLPGGGDEGMSEGRRSERGQCTWATSSFMEKTSFRLSS